ncbi:MAG: 4Fe-4S ferredoxin [Cyanobacteria bacterium REEB459]|nr:4Fe-4S ferredoxin [Cyanobacteria bacterium REEB459]
MPAIRSLVMIYTLAGVDCIDLAADPAVVTAARQGLADAQVDLNSPDRPWLMISLNDGEDPHFRKASFDPTACPETCPRPCLTICPTAAIDLTEPARSGVLPQLCYGCGRCMTICPVGHIVAQSHQVSPEALPPELWSQIDAIEIHTQTGQERNFQQLWQRLQPWLGNLKLISISCPDHPQVVEYLHHLYAAMAPLTLPLIWQTDGRPMSGDLGKGTTHATLRLAEKILAANLPGYVQLAGGTNHHTVRKMLDLGLVRSPHPAMAIAPPPNSPDGVPTIAGIAYGSYARTLIMPTMEVDDSSHTSPDILGQKLRQARWLVGQLKYRNVEEFVDL